MIESGFDLNIDIFTKDGSMVVSHLLIIYVIAWQDYRLSSRMP